MNFLKYLKQSFPFFKQHDHKDCGATCLKIISKYYKKSIPLELLRNLSETTRKGSSLLNLSDAAESLDFRSLGVKLAFKSLVDVDLPCILHWNNNHYVVLYEIHKDSFHISDPAHGLIKYSKKEFLECWIGNNTNDLTEEGIALLLEPTPEFYNSDFNNKKSSFGFSLISNKIHKNRKH